MKPTTEARETAARTSQEADQEQLDLAKQQGAAFRLAIREMTEKEAHGALLESGDYLIGYAVEEAEGLYHWRDGSLVWEEPRETNAHLEIVVCNRSDGRFLPGCTVQATLSTLQGVEIGSHEQPFLWHSWLYHYGRNWTLPEGEHEYNLRVHVDPPRYSRHDRKNGKRFTEPADVEFKRIKIKTGQKK